MQRYFKLASGNPSIILSWKFKGLSDESIKAPTTPNKIFNPSQHYVGTKARVRFNGACLKQEKITFNQKKNSKCLHCLRNRKKCKYKQLSYIRKQFIQRS